jgi:hypothetical protein
MPSSTTAAVLDTAVAMSGTMHDAAVDAPEDPCTVMRSTGDSTKASDGYATNADGYVPHLRERPLEHAIRQFYGRYVLLSQSDRENLAPFVEFYRGVVGTDITVEACVDHWRAAYPHEVEPGGSGRFAPFHRYVEVRFRFGDGGGDGACLYALFVDIATLEVVAAFEHCDHFEP